MTPSRCTIEAATPKCPKKGCDKPLTYDHGRELWVCPEHAAVVSTDYLTQKQA
jgi:hypothetical protein